MNPGVALRVLLVVLVVLVSAPLPPDAAVECVAVDDFSKARVGDFPTDWKPRKDEGKEIYSVQEERGRRFLRAKARGQGIQAGREHEWDLDTYPVLAWRWRPVEFPTGADEREPSTNDSVLAVYMLVPHSKVRGPQAVKYVWSERVPVGTWLESNGGLTQARVLKNGTGKNGEWIVERVNVRDDFLKAFKTREVPKPAGIAVLTDSDDTKSTAVGDYADFQVCRR
ncbi:MAG: DUF3047 domain-containing protein [Candidatus Rokubacteria bacterium]|nr:DUF3047 domain-containing protein [Candidatus Rokubacteria bacterium]